LSDWYDDSRDQADDDHFEWDHGNVHKLDDHRISATEAQEACLDPERKPASAYNVGGEHRRALVGATATDRIFFVVYTVRAGRIRVISARVATRDECRQYWR
jgi:uncharacterized DUF497 family protein